MQEVFQGIGVTGQDCYRGAGSHPSHPWLNAGNPMPTTWTKAAAPARISSRNRAVALFPLP